MVCIMRTRSLHACHYVKDHEQNRNSQPKEQSRAMVLWTYTCVEIYICMNTKPKAPKQRKGNRVSYVI